MQQSSTKFSRPTRLRCLVHHTNLRTMAHTNTHTRKNHSLNLRPTENVHFVPKTSDTSLAADASMLFDANGQGSDERDFGDSVLRRTDPDEASIRTGGCATTVASSVRGQVSDRALERSDAASQPHVCTYVYIHAITIMFCAANHPSSTSPCPPVHTHTHTSC